MMTNEMVAKLNAILVNLALLSGQALERWKKMLNVMLEKLASNDNVEKLCIILLFKVDFNNNNKWIGKQVMLTVEKHRLLTPEQYGSWKSKAAGTQCLNKCLFYNLYHCFQALMALCLNDTKSCYNRIVLIIAALCLCQFGATKTATKSMIAMLAQLWHHVCTAYGKFAQSQGQEEWTLPMVGIGQGNGAGPQIWMAVSLPLFEIMCADGYGFIATFICRISKQHWVMAGFAFMDNTDLIVSDSSQQASTVMKKMQQLLTMWHKLRQATGGDLVPEKCFWYFIDFKWQNLKWMYKTVQESLGQLQVTSSNNKSIMIPRLEPREA